MSRQPVLMEHLVPSATPAYTRLLGDNHKRLLDLDAEQIRTLWNPATCPADALPYLAWALSADLWDPAWPEIKKRSVLAQSLTLHKLKGTEEGISRHIDVVESKLLRTIAPPARGFYTPALTDAGRRAFLEGLPQVRIYPFATTRKAPRKRAFHRGSGGRKSFYGDISGSTSDFVQPSDGIKLYGRRATFYDKGVEIPASYDVLQDSDGPLAERIRIRSTDVKRKFYNNSFFGAAHWQATEANSNIVSVRLSNDASRQYATLTGSVVTDVCPERIYQARTAPRPRRFYGRFGGYYLTSYAPQLIFDRVTILDMSRLGERQKVRNFWGHTRYGIKPFSAEMLIEVPMKRAMPVMGRFITGFWKKADMSKLDNTLAAIRTSKSFRDTILVDTKVHRVVTLKDASRLGTFKLGQTIRVI